MRIICDLHGDSDNSAFLGEIEFIQHPRNAQFITIKLKHPDREVTVTTEDFNNVAHTLS